MNRRERRAALRPRRHDGGGDERVPVFGLDNRCIALVPQDQVKWYAGKPNARLVRRRDGTVVRIQLRVMSDDSGMVVRRGNPRRYSHDHENGENPPQVWMLRRLATPDSSADRFVRRIYRAAVLDNLRVA